MLRTGLGAFDALLGRGGLLKSITKSTGNRIITPTTKNTTKSKLWTRTISTTRSTTTTSPKATQFWATRFTNNSLLRTARLRTPAGARRPFQTSRVRRQETPPKPSGNGNGNGNTNSASLSLSQRLKKLSKEYGWTAVGVYLTLSVLDFPFCFLLVRIVGTEKIAAVEEIVVTNVQKAIPDRVKEFWHNYQNALKENTAKQQGDVAAGGEGEAMVAEDMEVAGWGVEEARERKAVEGASLATQLALAYAIHKSFIFVRVPLTAAILPKVVKVLRSWGYSVGNKAAKGAKGVKGVKK